MASFFMSHEKKLLRMLEILPGLLSWNIILFPYWGIFVFPNVVAYFVLCFNIYWFYQSLQTALTSVVSHTRIQASVIYDWMGDAKAFPDWKRVRHIVLIVTYKEPKHTLERLLDSLAAQDLPKEMMIPVLAQEDRAPDEHKRNKINELVAQYKNKLPNLAVTIHKLAPGEMIGKSSNERYAAVEMKKQLIDEAGGDINYYTVTSCDADHVYHPKHFSCLTYKFLDNPNRYLTFWQAAVLLYNNFWKLPSITRVNNMLGSIWNLSVLARKDKLINGANYSLSLKLLDEADYWDPDKIPEDWGMFFKAFYKKGGKVEVEPLYLPLYADAAESTSLIKTIKSQYEQYKRWAWGVSDTPWIIKAYLLNPKVSFVNKSVRLIQFLWNHVMWPVNWFIITIGLTLPTILNPAFGRTALGYTVPKLSSFVLTASLIFLVVMFLVDRSYRPQRPKDVPFWRALLLPFEFILMPITGFIFGALPGLDAHTRLMLGKYIEYKVTEKV